MFSTIICNNSRPYHKKVTNKYRNKQKLKINFETSRPVKLKSLEYKGYST